MVEDRLMRRPDTRVVAVSNFTAGALLSDCQATILPPGLSANWFATLVDAAKAEYYREPGVHLMTAFRLVDFRSKGLPQILAAVARLGRSDVRMTVAGSGPAPAEMCQLIGKHPWCRLRSGLSNEELAAELATADLFVLASRTRHGHGASGEGFGMVLLEAQVAGTPVVGPAFGGSHEAFLRQVTGEAPVDETAQLTQRQSIEPATEGPGEAEADGTAGCTMVEEVLRSGRLCVPRSQRPAVTRSPLRREYFSRERYAPQAVARFL